MFTPYQCNDALTNLTLGCGTELTWVKQAMSGVTFFITNTFY